MTERALVFGEVAELYDSERADYPDELVDDVVEYADLGPGDRVLEVGGGTGIATRAFATRGLAIHVVEPSEPMADVLRARTVGLPVTVQGCRFEEWTPDAEYPLLFSAQAWHWVDPATRYRAASSALRDRGTIALFGHRPHVAPPLREPIEAAHATHEPEKARRPYFDDVAYAPEFATELADSGLFASVEHRTYGFNRSYDTAGFLRLMSTMSDHRVLDPERRSRLRADLAAIIDGAGGVVVINYRTDLYLARAAGRPATA
jgi:SAM-dependent methyltransferase